MQKKYRIGAIGALLDEYERAINDLKIVLSDVSDKDLATIVDTQTTDEDCRSIQTIMGHVVRSAYGYAIYIYRHLGEDFEFRTTVLRGSVQEYFNDIDAAFQFNVALFEKYPNLNLEEFENEKKVFTRWGQVFDYDQLLEHAIVHILRHRRQIEKFKNLLP
jgi:uncharacterized damage-inducible protein DinB